MGSRRRRYPFLCCGGDPWLLAEENDEVKVDELLFTGPETVVRTSLRSSETDPTQKGAKSLAVVVEPRLGYRPVNSAVREAEQTAWAT